MFSTMQLALVKACKKEWILSSQEKQEEYQC